NIAGSEAADLVRFLRTLLPRNGSQPQRISVTLDNGQALAGLVFNQTLSDLQLRGDHRKIHRRQKTADRYRPVTSQTDWATYNGSTTGSRYSQLAQIDKSN